MDGNLLRYFKIQNVSEFIMLLLLEPYLAIQIVPYPNNESCEQFHAKYDISWHCMLGSFDSTHFHIQETNNFEKKEVDTKANYGRG